MAFAKTPLAQTYMATLCGHSVNRETGTPCGNLQTGHCKETKRCIFSFKFLTAEGRITQLNYNTDLLTQSSGPLPCMLHLLLIRCVMWIKSFKIPSQVWKSELVSWVMWLNTPDPEDQQLVGHGQLQNKQVREGSRFEIGSFSLLHF